MTPEELAAIRERDRAAYWSTDDDPEHQPPYLMAEEGHSYTLADRRALLAHIDAITEAVEDMGGYESRSLTWVRKLDVLALLRGTPQ